MLSLLCLVSLGFLLLKSYIYFSISNWSVLLQDPGNREDFCLNQRPCNWFLDPVVPEVSSFSLFFSNHCNGNLLEMTGPSDEKISGCWWDVCFNDFLFPWVGQPRWVSWLAIASPKLSSTNLWTRKFRCQKHVEYHGISHTSYHPSFLYSFYYVKLWRVEHA